MNGTLGLSLLVSVATGVLLLRLAWPRHAAPFPLPLGIALGFGLGTGLSSVLLFLWMIAFGPTRGFPLAEVGLLGIAAIAGMPWRWGGRATQPPTAPTPPGDGPRRGSRLLAFVLVSAALVALGAATAAFLSLLRQHPHGEWDAWMNWDLRARMIFRGGDQWRTAFSAAIPWSHPDYPMLVPSLVVRNWLYAGTDTLRGPALVAAAFTFGTVALLAGALAVLRSPSQGLLAGLILLGTPFFIVHGVSLYGDVPLGFFFLATMVFLALDGRYGAGTTRFAALAGVTAGLAMWTKNEGLLFGLAVVAGVWLTGVRTRQRTGGRLRAFGTGLLPLVLLVAGFKIAFAPPNDLLSTLGVGRTLGRLTAPDRYYLVIRDYVSHIASFGDNGLAGAAWPLAACLLALGLSRDEAGQAWARAGATALALMLAGHFAVFVSMADELARLLNSSLDRLLLQLWPSALFLLFMVVRTPEEAGAGRLQGGLAAEAGGGR